MARDPAFDVRLTREVEPGHTLLVGFADPGIAGLTAVDYLINQLVTTQVGHVATTNLPDLTPFSDGQPRRPIRLYTSSGSDVLFLISEVFLPVWVADPFADALTAWLSSAAIDEVTILYGASISHRETEHVTYHVATESYRERHFGANPSIEPLSGGFFDGVIAELLVRGMDTDRPPTGVLLTPAHLPGPDYEAALRLLDGLEIVYDIDVDETDLQRRAEEMRQYFETLAQRLETVREDETAYGSRDFPDDRMYM